MNRFVGVFSALVVVAAITMSEYSQPQSAGFSASACNVGFDIKHSLYVSICYARFA